METTMNMSKIIRRYSDRALIATVEHYLAIQRAGRLHMLSTSERAEFDAAYNEAMDRELRVC
jgi:hypothetical protein